MDGTAFGDYRLHELLGNGGMGEVYKAYDTTSERMIALKVLPAQYTADEEYRNRFLREAKAVARLQEPHVIPIHRFGEIDGRLFVDMALVDGIDVQKILARTGPMTPERAVHVIEQAASALDAAHNQGLVHRDVKPSNLLVTANDFTYLIDLGVADVSEEPLSRTGVAVGTFAYMAPERFTEGRSDARVDVYALACVLSECLTGSRPFPGNTVYQQYHGHFSLTPPRPSDSHPSIPVSLDNVVARGMAKDPAARYGSAGQLAEAAYLALHRTEVTALPGVGAARAVGPVPKAVGARNGSTPVPARPYSAAPTSTSDEGQTRTRRQALIALAALTVVLVAVVIGFLVWRGSGHAESSQPATTSTGTGTNQAATVAVVRERDLA